ncbi:MAG TPA: DUF3854 domain-containing protein [Blastocatellia bacterium]|nr:DUF3854 domain-containing protein [Blastocatellia bacterium]
MRADSAQFQYTDDDLRRSGLTRRDIEKLAESTIPIGMALAAGIYRVDTVEGARLVGRRATIHEDYAGLVFPYYPPEENSPREYRLRRDHPDYERKHDGSIHEVAKYLSPPQSSPKFYYPPGLKRAWLTDVSIPVIFCEGEKKALCLWRIALERMQDGKPPFIVIGLAGVYAWKGRLGKEELDSGEVIEVKGAIADLHNTPLENRRTTIFFDANVHTNPNVKTARTNFTYYLRDERQADVYHADTPQLEGVNGPDDWAYLYGDEVVFEAIQNAKPARRYAAVVEENRKEAAEAWKKILEEFKSRPGPSECAKQVLGTKVWKRLAELWAKCGLEPEERDLLFTLHALAEDRREFDFYYKDLYPLLYRADGNELENGRLTNSARQTLRRRFDRLAAAEENIGIRFVNFRPGYKDSEASYPSHIELLSLDYIEQIEAIAEATPGFTRGKKATREAAIEKFISFKSGKVDHKPKPRPNPHKAIQDGWKRVTGAVNANVERMRAQGYEDWAIWHDLADSLPPEFLAFIRQSSGPEPPAGDTYSSMENRYQPEPASPTCEAQGVGIKSDTLKSPQVALDSTDDFAGFEKTCSDSPVDEGSHAPPEGPPKIAKCPQCSDLFMPHPSGLCQKCRPLLEMYAGTEYANWRGG